MKKIDPAFQIWAERFLNHLKNERRLSERTTAAYQRDINQFLQYCQKLDLDNLAAVRVHQVRQYASDRHRHGLGGRSLQRELSALRRFFEYLIRENEVPNNPVHGVQAPKYQKPLPKPLDVDQMIRLLGEVPDESAGKSAALPALDTLLTIRDLTMLELMYSCGLRVAELVSLDILDLDLSSANLPVTGKGGKKRILPIGRMALQRLETWLVLRNLLVPEQETALFVSKQGRRLSVRSVQARFRQWGKRCGLDTVVHPHRLRHAFASHMLESSGDLRAVQELLGHADISTTQVYTHLDYQHLANIYDKAHPRAKKKV